LLWLLLLLLLCQLLLLFQCGSCAANIQHTSRDLQR
jgi:hypothetical protein